MSAYRDGFGRIKRQEPNRDWRRAHAKGAQNLVMKGEKMPADFKGRLRVMLEKMFR